MSKKINIFALTVLIIFQTILMPLGTYGVTFANGNDSDSETTGSSVTSSPIDLSFDYLKYDGKEITKENASTISPKAGDAVSVHYSFALKEDETMDIGETFEFTLPDQLLIFDKSRLQGEIKSGNDTYFTYSTDDNRKVTVTVVQPLPYGITGNMNFSAVFGNFGNNKELSQELVIQLTDNHVVKIPLKFEPKEKGQNVSKEGVLKTSGANKSIEWTAWFNLNKATLSNFTFTDTIGADHALPQNAVIKVHEASVKADLEGVAVEDGSLKEVTNDMNITVNGNVITVQPKKATSTEKAYMVTYSTSIDTSKADKELETYSNSFTVTDANISDSKAWTAKKDVSVEYGTPLSKERTGGDKYRADWFIQFNHIGKSIPASTTITDTLTGGLHKYDYSTFVVTKRPIVNGIVTSPGELMTLDTDYQFTTKGDNQFVIELLDVDEAYAVDIQYSTIATKEFIYEAGAINNKVETSLKDNTDMPYTISTNWNLPPGVGYKNLSDVDYSKKLLEWTVVVDTEGLDMKKLVIEDSFTKGLDLVPYDNQGTLYKLESAPAGVTVKSFEAKEGTDEETGLQTGFKLEFDEPTGGFKGKVVFKYQTRYDALDNYITHQNGYKNEVNFSWDGVTSVGNNLTKKVTFTPEEVQKTSVDKTGTYNYANREFNWTAVFNANRNTIQKAQITDTLSAGQKYKGSVEIYKVTVDKNGQLSADKDRISPDLYDVSLEGATSFTVTFKNPITDAYEIRYKSEDADDIIGHTGEKGGEYTNTIAITDAISNISLGSKTATVKVNDANVLVSKNGQQIPASSTINWSVEVNPSQSNLTNVILEDKPAVPQSSKALHWLISDDQVNYPITITEITFDENGRKKGTTIAAREAKAAGWLKNDPVITKEGFKFEFVDLTGADGKPRAFIVNYSTYYDGPHQGEYTNSAKLSYKANDQENFKEDGVDKSEAKYNHNDSDAYANFNRTNLVITKIGKDNDKGEASDKLAGAKFELWNKNGKIRFGEATTNADGIATFQNIGYGVYILKEIKGPEGYVVTKNEQVIRVTSGDNSITPPVSATLEVQNDEILQSVELTKKFTGMDANKSKAGVKFELYNALDNQKVIVPVWAVQNGEKKKTGITVGPEFITDENGKIYIADLPDGKYYFKEVETLPGYALPTRPDSPTFTIENGKTTSEKISMSNEPLKQTITNVKGDPEDNTQGTTPIKDSTFKVYKVTDSCPADGSTFVPANHEDVTKFLHSSGVLTTDSNGQIVIDYSKLGAGKFIIVQDRVNKYYENRMNIVVDCVEITTTKTEVTPTTFENERTSTVDPLTLVKVDTDTNPKPVKDATIKLVGRTVANGGAGKTYFGKTNAQGEITAWYEGTSYPTTPDLSKAVTPVPDQYTVSEPAMPVGYMALEQKSGAEGFVRKLVFDYNNVDIKTVINVTNTKIIRDIVIKNTCGQDETTYKLLNSKGTVMTTDVLGNPITVKAFDKTGKEIQGATIDGDGVITMPAGATTVKIINLHIAKDSYTVQQITSSSGCQLVDEPKSFPVDDSPTGTITFDETDPPITVTVTNKDKDSNDKIAGSTFKLYKADVAVNCPGNNDEVNLTGYKEVTKYSDGTNITLTTNAQGQFKIDFSKLGKGSYIIVQDQVNTYYENRPGEAVNFGASNCIVIEPNKDKQPDHPIFTNDRTSTTADVILVKKDADDATRALAGAVIKLQGTKFTNRETYYGKTGTDGRITTWYASEEDAKAGNATGGIQKLEPNDYKVTEIVYPEGYTTLAGETTFIYKNDSTDTQIDITNKKIMSTFVIKNACGLEESKYQILDANGQVVKVDLSGKDIGVDGVITMSAGETTVSAGAFHLPKGEYSIEQLTASGGCLLEDNSQKVTTPDGENPTLTFEEKDPPNKIIVTNNEEGSITPIVDSTFDVYKVTSCPDLKDSGTVAITEEMEHKGTFTTNKKGQFEVDFSQFGSGTYIIVQNEVAKYYINKNGVPVEVALTEGAAKVICIPVGNTDEDSPEEPTFENTRQTTELKLSKYSIGTNKPVVGAEIQIKGSIKGNIYKSTTDEKGEINFGIVVEDLYIVTEVTTPKGFKSNTLGVKEGAVTTKKENGKVTFDFFGTNTATDKALIQVTNERLLSTVEILNSCGQEESTYEIHRKTESGYVKVTTDVEGKVIGENGVIKMAAKAGKVTLTLHLPDGEYKVVQTSASGGCIFEDQNPPSEDQPDFKIETEEDKTYPIDETDQPNKQVVTNEEKGTTTKVPGSTFELHRVAACGADGTVDVTTLTSSTLIDSFTTNASGTITIDYSQYGSGTYVFIQKTVGNEYLLLNEEPVSLGGSSDCLPIGPNDKQVPPTSFKNERGKGTLTLVKKDAANSNKVLENAEFEIVGKQTNEKRTGTTNTEGKLVLTDLPYDEYTITETKAPGFYTGSVVVTQSFKATTLQVDITNTIVTNPPLTNDVEGSTFTFKVCNDPQTAAGTYQGTNFDYVIDEKGNISVVYNGTTYTNFEVTETGILVIPGTTVQFVLPAGDYCYEQQLPPNGKTEHEPLPPGKVTVPPTTSPGTPTTNIDLFDVELSFASCEGPLSAGTYTLTNKATNKTYEVIVGEGGKASTAYVPNGDYTITGNGMVERTLTVAGDTTETIQTQDCGTLAISFDRCDKLGTTAIYVFEKGATTPTYTLPFTPGANGAVVDISKYLPVAEYIVIPATNDTVPTDLSKGTLVEVKEGTTANVSIIEPCGTEEIIINFNVCDRSPITTIDVYQIDYGTTETFVKTVEVKDGGAQINLAEGFYMAYPGGTKVNGEPIFVSEANTAVTLVTGSCPDLQVEIEFKACDRITSGDFNIYAADASGEPTGQALETFTLDNKTSTTVLLPNGEYVIVNAENEVVGNISINDQTTALSVVEITTTPCPDIQVEIEFKACDRITSGEFSIYTADGNGQPTGQVVETFKLDNKTSTTVSLPNGEYVIVNAENEVVGNIFINDQTTALSTVEITATPCPTLEVELSFKACDRIETGVITIYNEAGEVAAEETVNNGETGIVELPNGKYVVKDEDGNEIKSFEIDDATTEKQLVAVTVIPCPDLEVELKFTSCDRIDSGVITIYNEAGEEVVTKTVKNGETIIVELPNGKYVAKDENGNEIKSFEIYDQTTETQLVAVTVIPCPDLEVELKFTSCDRIDSGVITIYNEAGEEVVTKTVKNGETIIVELPNGKYVAKDEDGNEIKSFEIDDKTTEPQLVTLTVIPCPDLQVVIEFKACDRITSGVFNIFTKDENGKPTGESKEKFTLKNGHSTTVELPNGNYVIVDEYNKVVGSIKIEDSTTELSTVEITATPCPDLEVELKFTSCDRIDSGVITIYNEAGEEVVTKTVKNGETIIVELPNGKYVAKDEDGNEIKSFEIDDQTTDKPVVTLTVVYCPTIQVIVPIQACDYKTTTTLQLFEVVTVNGEVTYEEITTATITNNVATFAEAKLTPGKNYVVVAQGENPSVSTSTFTYTGNELTDIQLPVHVMDCPPVCAKTIEFDAGLVSGTTVTIDEKTYVVSESGTVIIPMHTIEAGTYEVKEGNKVIGTIVVNEDCSVIYTPVPPKASSKVEVEFKEQNSCLLYDERTFAIYYFTENVGGEGVDWYIIHTFETSANENFMFELRHGQYYVIDITNGKLPKEVTEATLKAATTPISFTVEQSDTDKEVLLPDAECRSSFTFKFMRAFVGIVIVEKPDGTIETIEVKEGEEPTYTPTEPGDYTFCPQVPEGEEPLSCVTNTVPNTTGDKTTTKVTIDELDYRDPVDPEIPVKPEGNEQTPKEPTPNPGTDDNDGEPTPNPGTEDNDGEPTPNPGTEDNDGEPTPNPGTDDNDGETPTPNPEAGGNGGKTPKPKPTPNPEVGGNNGGGTATIPSTIKVPNLGELVSSINNDPTKAKEVLEELKTFIAQYNKLSAEEKRQLGPVDVESILAQIELLENKLTAQEKLPQTNGDTSNTATLIGLLLLLLSACLLARKRFAK